MDAATGFHMDGQFGHDYSNGPVYGSRFAGHVTITAVSGSVRGTTTATITPFLNLQDASLATLVSTLFAQDGEINRDDMIQILEYVATENGGVLDAMDFSDL